MNRRNKLVIFALTFIGFSIAYNNFYTAEMISGTYIYNFPNAGADGPSHGDHLILKENGNFKSDTWGNGRYVISGSKLQLTYSYAFGKAGYECNIYRPFFWGLPRFSVVRDLEYYFEKKD